MESSRGPFAWQAKGDSMNELPSHLEEALLRLVREKLFDGGEPMTVETDLLAAGLDSMGIMQLMI